MLKVALIGRPNVGKSTLFNCLVGARKAIVSPLHGLTRDRHYGVVERSGKAFLLIDTGGLKGGGELDAQVTAQARRAMDECDLICFMVSAADGLTVMDESLVREIRRAGKPLWMIVNKVDGQDQRFRDSEFAALGISPCFYTAAVSNRGVPSLLEKMLEQVGRETAVPEDDRIRVAFIGRPNAGKSTMINALIGEDRLVTSPTPGTTRDSITVPFSCIGRDFSLVDTAGVRRKAKVAEGEERFSVIRALESIIPADVVVLVCNALDGVTDQDAHLAAQAIEHGRALVVAVNKSDLIDADVEQNLRRTLDARLRFVGYVEKRHTSAIAAAGLEALMHAVADAYNKAAIRVPTAQCNAMLQAAVERHLPPTVAGRPITLRYMCQTGIHPPSFIIHGRRVNKVPDSYKRYLASCFRRQLSLHATPINLEFRLSD